MLTSRSRAAKARRVARPRIDVCRRRNVDEPSLESDRPLPKCTPKGAVARRCRRMRFQLIPVPCSVHSPRARVCMRGIQLPRISAPTNVAGYTPQPSGSRRGCIRHGTTSAIRSLGIPRGSPLGLGRGLNGPQNYDNEHCLLIDVQNLMLPKSVPSHARLPAFDAEISQRT
jgi:hypothetical protein